MATTLATLREIRRTQRADGPAAMLAIGTANPTNCVLQEEFPDYYFRVTNKEHLTDLKETFKKLCKQACLVVVITLFFFLPNYRSFFFAKFDSLELSKRSST